MQSVRNYIVAISVVAVVFVPELTSAQMPAYPPEFSPRRTSRPPKPQETQAPLTKFVKRRNAIPNWYIVVLNDDVVASNSSLEVRRAAVTAIASSHAKAYRGKVCYIYETALKGYSIELPDEAAAIALSQNPQVKWVEEDARIEWIQGSGST
jgi:Peptidase inhibitor I9